MASSLFTLVGKIVIEGKQDVALALKETEASAKKLQTEFRNLERVTRPMGMALVGIGAGGLAAAKATENWNNALGDALQKLKPVFVAITAIGGLLLTLPPIIRGAVVAFNLLKATALSTAGILGVFGAGLGAVGLLVYGLTQIFPAMKADTDRWSNSLATARDRLEELEESGKGASVEAGVLRDAIDDLTYTLAQYDTVGDDNKVTTDNLTDAIEKLADAKNKLDGIDEGLLDVMQRFNRETNIGGAFWRIYDIMVGDTASDVVELTENIIALSEAQEEEAEQLREDNIKALEDYYGVAREGSKSLLEMFEDETDAQRDALEEQVKQYRRAYDEKVSLFNAETDKYIGSLQKQLDALNDSQQEVDRIREDEDDAKTEAELRAAVDAQWTRKGRAEAEEALADFLEERSRKLEDRKLDDQKGALQDQITETQNAANKQLSIWQTELNNFNLIKDAELTALEQSVDDYESILQTKLNLAVQIQDEILQHSLDNIQTELAAQLSAWSAMSVPPMAQAGTAGVGLGLGGSIRGYATGGPIIEDSLLVGMRSGRPYAMAHEGERVTPRGGGNVTINVNGGTYSQESDRQALAREIGRELYRQRQMNGNFGGS